jgi:hypothetical protein
VSWSATLSRRGAGDRLWREDTNETICLDAAGVSGTDVRTDRPDIIIPFGFLSMVIQGAVFAWLYERVFAVRFGRLWTKVLAYGAVGAMLSWSFTTLAVAGRLSHL